MGETRRCRSSGKKAVLHTLIVTKRACVATVLFLFFLGLCHRCLPESFTLQPLVKQNSTVTLLIWNHPFIQRQQLPDCYERFQISGCALTDDRRAYPRADAVIVHHREVAVGDVELPQDPRPRVQKWIWMNYESPTHTPRLWTLEGLFNLTMSYRTDSDIFLPYGYLIPRTRETKIVESRSTHLLQRPTRILRPRLVAWVISNWSESHARVALYHRLRRFISVDVFGAAGLPVPEDSGGESVVQLLGRYQFYLALENSRHADYVTEKLWNAVQAGAIPVVLGPTRNNYERFLPPEAFIHVDDFPTVRGLARYLLMLRRNPFLLRRHLNWRGQYALHRPVMWAEHYCAACRATKRTRSRTDEVTDLTNWFYS